MKYGRVFRTKLREVDPITAAVYGPYVLQSIMTKNYSGLKAVAAQDYGESKIGGGTALAKKFGRRLGVGVLKARESSRVWEAASDEQAARAAASVADDAPKPTGDVGDGTYTPKRPRVKYGFNKQEQLMKNAPHGINIVTDPMARGMRKERVGRETRDRLKDTEQRLQARAAKTGNAKSAEMLGKVKAAAAEQDNTKLGEEALSRRTKQRMKQKAWGKALNTAEQAKLKNVAMPTWGSRFGGTFKGFGAIGMVAATKLAKSVGDAAQEVSRTASAGYADMQRGIRMGGNTLTASADGSSGNLKENQKTWATRRARYGKSGRKHKTWKFDFNKPTHVKKALKLKSDTDIKKLMKSSADITKHVGMNTAGGVPLKFAFRSNNGKHLYAGKTIGMRQNIISSHKKLGIPLPKGFENFSFDQVNELFKKRDRHGWYKRQYNKAPLHRKLMIGVGKLWKGVKKSFGIESAIVEDATLTESAPPAVVECIFMDGRVATPTECDCPDCLAVTRRIRENEKVVETAATSFGQNLRGDTQPTPPMPTTAATPKKLSTKQMKAANKRWRKPLGA